ncbi:MAG: radical SAM protein [Bdellovibrionales bacterium]|nr:radical SAM protein [Bdellovibrionales bacterium]NQZ18135.1 radical SAM protein [Bdellovibrionales bacterium]
MNWSDKFEKVYIDKAAENSEVALRFFEVFGDKAQIIDGEPKDIEKGPLSGEQFTQSKKQIFVTNFKGSFFKKCPGYHKGLACCNYFVLNLGFQCDMDCSYCYLQSFINSNYLTVYANIDEALEELRQFKGSLGDSPVRVGTGEVIDSLSLDPITLYSRKLIEFFNDFPNWKLEFKTKSAFVDQFLDCDHKGNTMVSWSINPPTIIEQEEHGTASFEQRMEAAEKCVNKGFPLSFHIDPMIWHPEWKDSYAYLVDEITRRFKPEDVLMFSVGALRFQPQQKNIMRERFGMNSLVTRAETFQSQDGKLRYDQKLREEMFQFVRHRLRENSPHWKIFMCMETPETWNNTFGHSPHREKPLKEYFQTIKT